MKEELINAIGNKLDDIHVFIDDVLVIEEANEKVLTVVLDSSEIIDLKTVVKATRIINPIVDSLGLTKDVDTLDVYAKEKGCEVDE